MLSCRVVRRRRQAARSWGRRCCTSAAGAASRTTYTSRSWRRTKRSASSVASASRSAGNRQRRNTSSIILRGMQVRQLVRELRNGVHRSWASAPQTSVRFGCLRCTSLLIASAALCCAARCIGLLHPPRFSIWRCLYLEVIHGSAARSSSTKCSFSMTCNVAYCV